MLQLMFAMLWLGLAPPAHAAEAPNRIVTEGVAATLAPPTPQLARGWRTLTRTGLTLVGLGVGLGGFGLYAFSQGGTLVAATSAGAGGLLLVGGTALALLSTGAQARHIGASPRLANHGWLLAAGGVVSFFLGGALGHPINVPFVVALPVLAVSSTVLAAVQGSRNVRHVRQARVGVLPQLRPHTVGLTLAVVW